MRYLTLSLACLFVVLATGCGGNGPRSEPSPFEGAWAGEWVVTRGADASFGVMEIVVARNGDYQGAVDSRRIDPAAEAEVIVDSGAISGHMHRKGGLGGGMRLASGETWPFSGRVAVSGAGGLAGNFTATINGVQHPGTFNLFRR